MISGVHYRKIPAGRFADKTVCSFLSVSNGPCGLIIGVMRELLADRIPPSSRHYSGRGPWERPESGCCPGLHEPAIMLVGPAHLHAADTGLPKRPELAKALAHTRGPICDDPSRHDAWPTFMCAPRLVSIRWLRIRLLRSASARQKDYLRIGVFSSLASGFLAELIRTFRGKYGSVRVDFVDGDPEDHLAAVRQTRLDVAFLTGTSERAACETTGSKCPAALQTPRRLITRADAKCRSFASVLRQAARASSETRSHVVACMLGRACIRASQLSRLACGAPRTDHSGVAVNNSTAGATIKSASEIASPAK